MSTKVKKELPTILITNDDGIDAPGIRNLVEAVRGMGNIIVVAPDKGQSAMGHAITIGHPLRITKTNTFDGIDSWKTTGTPVDCVKLAVAEILHRKPDICLSGINHGANHAINVIYSGTMSAAMEAAIESIPSIGFSLMDYNHDADFTLAKEVVQTIVKKVLAKKQDKHLLLNVNIPNIPKGDLKGIKLCRQAYAKYEENFLERKDPHGKTYYWLTGEFKNFDKGKDTDVWALEHNYVSIVPISIDFTDYTQKQKLETQWGNLF
jgi:5'-nucleotidase